MSKLPEEIYLCRNQQAIYFDFSCVNKTDNIKCGMNSIGMCDIDSEKCEVSKYIKED